MFLLLHGNRTPAPNGSVSPQLVARTARAIDRFFDRAQEPVRKICFFAADEYPDGSCGSDHVFERLRKHGVKDDYIHIDPVATTTREEVAAFCDLVPSTESVGYVTSLYHVARAGYLLRVRGFNPTAYQTYAFDLLDTSLEPMKLAMALAYD